MAQGYSVNVTTVRDALQPHVDAAQRAVDAGVQAVKDARQQGDEARARQNEVELHKARRILHSLQAAQLAMTSTCCDEATQGCNFNYL